MDSGIYAAYTGLMARTQALDTAANNLANTGTSGFRAQKDFFRGVMVDSGLYGSPGFAAASQVGNSVNSFGVLGGNQLDLSQGVITATGNPLDVALRGQGFFAIQSGKSVMYTRNGAFTRSPEGILQTPQGEAVLDAQGKAITVPSGVVHVAPDGSISVATPNGSALAGQIGIFDFADKSQLQAESNGRVSVPSSTKPSRGAATVEQGAVEGANEDAIHGTMQLVLVQRQAEMMQKALSVFNNEFDKTAAEELPRV